jgi:lysyl-tRNA synthetase class 1
MTTTYQSWTFIEAEKIADRIKHQIPPKGYVLFETGYGPSGLPHIGTFGEVARTSMVMNAFQKLYPDIPCKLFAFSDDLDGLRKIPDNIPNPDLIRPHLGKPLSTIPDPFGTHESFAHHMNARLCAFLDNFGFEYEFKSATKCYQSGLFDEILLKILQHYEEIMQIMLPTLGEERQATYSPFLPICPKTGQVLQVPISRYNLAEGTVTYLDSQEEVTVPVTGGNCKLQWKVDWAMRWCALGVDFEMHGKDLMSSAELSSKICSIIGYAPPVLYKYELFLDEKGQKISKSKGNGLTMEQWLRYAPLESLNFFMYQSPGKAKKLFFDVIPKQVDDYLTFMGKYSEGDINNPLWHVHNNNVPKYNVGDLNFNLLLNLASACNPENKQVLWGFISTYSPSLAPENAPFLDQLVDHAICYYQDFVLPNKNYRIATEEEKSFLQQMLTLLKSLPANATAEEIQNQIYNIAKSFNIELRSFFQAMYEILLGQSQGPRLGSFIKLYGISDTITLIEDALTRK